MVPLEHAPKNAIDVCGTGGDGQHSLNVSTAVALVVAACDVPVAKHGNRAASSKAGAADTLEALGLNLANASARAGETLNDVGICFFFAQAHHPALGGLAPIRKKLGRRTIFNLLGPLCNPARVKKQLIGLAHPDLIAVYAEAATMLDYDHAMIVSGDEGLDELSIAGTSQFADVRGDIVTRGQFAPSDIGVATAPLAAIRGGDAEFNAGALNSLLMGDISPYRDTVLMNAAAALMVAGEVDNMADGLEEAREALDKGLAMGLLKCWIEMCA